MGKTSRFVESPMGRPRNEFKQDKDFIESSKLGEQLAGQACSTTIKGSLGYRALIGRDLILGDTC